MNVYAVAHVLNGSRADISDWKVVHATSPEDAFERYIAATGYRVNEIDVFMHKLIHVDVAAPV